MDITANYRALKIDYKTTLVVPKEHFDTVYEVAKAAHYVHEVAVAEDMLKDAILLITS